MPKPILPSDLSAARDALRRRIEDALASFGDIELSTWMTERPPAPAQPPLDDHRTQASEVEVDAELGRLLWQPGARLEPLHCVHVIGVDGTLVAVIRPACGTVFARTSIAQDDLPGLSLHRRPTGAGTAPVGYRHTSVAALLWRFALFGNQGDQALPDHYRQLPLRLHQLPPLEYALVAGRHFKLMELLRMKNRTFTELQTLTGLSTAQLRRDLAALRLVGSLVIA